MARREGARDRAGAGRGGTRSRRSRPGAPGGTADFTAPFVIADSAPIASENRTARSMSSRCNRAWPTPHDVPEQAVVGCARQSVDEPVDGGAADRVETAIDGGVERGDPFRELRHPETSAFTQRRAAAADALRARPVGRAAWAEPAPAARRTRGRTPGTCSSCRARKGAAGSRRACTPGARPA